MIFGLLRFFRPGGAISRPPFQSGAAIREGGGPVSTLSPAPTAPAPAKHFPQTIRRTPNVSSGRVIRPTHIVLHHTSGSYNGSVSWCLNPASKVSYHCIVARNGERTVLALPTQRTWHAGQSSWQGRTDANSWSVGLAWEGDTNTTPLTDDAVQSAAEYLRIIIEDYKIPVTNILRHADIAPNRKNDCSIEAHKQLLAVLTCEFNERPKK